MFVGEMNLQVLYESGISLGKLLFVCRVIEFAEGNIRIDQL